MKLELSEKNVVFDDLTMNDILSYFEKESSIVKEDYKGFMALKNEYVEKATNGQVKKEDIFNMKSRDVKKLYDELINILFLKESDQAKK